MWYARCSIIRLVCCERLSCRAVHVETNCCDGSDEKPGVCPNKCKEIGDAYKAQLAAERKLRKTVRCPWSLSLHFLGWTGTGLMVLNSQHVSRVPRYVHRISRSHKRRSPAWRRKSRSLRRISLTSRRKLIISRVCTSITFVILFR